MPRRAGGRTPVISGRTAPHVSTYYLVSGMTDRRRVWFSPAAGGGWLGAAGAPAGRNIVRVHVVVPEGFDNPRPANRRQRL